MTQLVLLVVAAAWAAVLLPPMLRSRVDNRPNSSVTDFRRQLNKLQSTAAPPARGMRLGRALAPSAGRAGIGMRAAQPQPVLRSGVTPPRPAGTPSRPPARDLETVGGGTVTVDPMRRDERRDVTGPQRRGRTHGDPSGGMRRHGDPSGAARRPATVDEWIDDREEWEAHRDTSGATRRRDHTGGVRRHGDPTGGMRRPGSADDRTLARRRRSNVLFVLVIATACTLFLAATTGSTVMLYGFALSFLALCGYVYLLAQVRQREDSHYAGWLDTY